MKSHRLLPVFCFGKQIFVPVSKKHSTH